MENKHILISGAGIAGPALAYWLSHYGFYVTVLERSPALRGGGYKIDIRGAAMEVVKKMGLYPQVKEKHTNRKGALFVNKKNKVAAGLDSEIFGFGTEDDVEIMRGELSEILYESTRSDVEYIFDESITSISEEGDSLLVTFRHTPARLFDLVIGADGIHSNVRKLVFGDESQYLKHLGHHLSVFTIPNFLKLDRTELIYAMPGKVINVYHTSGSDDAKALFVFPSGQAGHRRSVAAQQAFLRDTFGNNGWYSAEILEGMKSAPDFYFDSISQVVMPAWYKGRVALLGDAGYSPSAASGQGTSLALVGAYILAGELKETGGDYKKAFKAYSRQMKVFVSKNQKLGADNVKHMVPAKQWKIKMQLFMIRTLNYLPWRNAVVKKIARRVNEAANAVELKEYELTIVRDLAFMF